MQHRKTTTPSHLVFTALILSMVAGVTLGIVGHEYYAARRDADLAMDDLADFAAAVREIRASYVEPLDAEAIVENAIRGVVDGLDAHSAFLDRADYDELAAQTLGQFGGIGVELGIVAGEFKVIAPIDGTPAQRAGVRAGDTLVLLDHEPVRGLSLKQVVDTLRGQPGSSVRLSVSREASPDLLEFELERALVSINSIQTRMLDGNVGYVRIAQFQTTTGRDLEGALGRMQDEHGPLSGLILDLRDNPGGVLQSSVSVSDAFLTDGTIVYTEGRRPSAALRFNATPDDLIDGAPMAVLINHGSASAAEVVAGALQDHGRAVIVGGRSFGKGSVQSVLPINGQRAIKLTTAHYFTPLGRSIQDWGIEPDVAIESVRETAGNDAIIRTALDELAKMQLARR